jgi:hypothetical protein
LEVPDIVENARRKSGGLLPGWLSEVFSKLAPQKWQIW